MRKTIILLTAVAVSATTLSFANVAFAKSGDRAGREPMTRTEVETRTGEAFAKLDINGDGVLSKADREANIAEHFAKADSDGNGQLSLAEATAAREARRDEWRERATERPRGDRQRADRRMGRGGRGGLERLGGMLRAADADGDEQISQAEFNSVALARFDRADADGDGAITREDRRAMRAEHRAKRSRSGDAGE